VTLRQKEKRGGKEMTKKEMWKALSGMMHLVMVSFSTEA
jgi:hypothetical protein